MGPVASMKSLVIALIAAGVAAAGSASACDVGALGGLTASSIDSVTVQFETRKPEMPLEGAGQVAALMRFINGLGADWTAGGPASSDGVIRFYQSGNVAASVWISESALKTDNCSRAVSAEEFDELFSILAAS